jgi:hypothetical protein
MADDGISLSYTRAGRATRGGEGMRSGIFRKGVYLVLQSVNDDETPLAKKRTFLNLLEINRLQKVQLYVTKTRSLSITKHCCYDEPI